VSFTAALQKVAANYQTTLLLVDFRRRVMVERVLDDLRGHRIGHRPNRVEPRAIKRRPKPHKWLKEPREAARARLGPVPNGTDSQCYGPDGIAAAERTMEIELAAESTG